MDILAPHITDSVLVLVELFLAAKIATFVANFDMTTTPIRFAFTDIKYVHSSHISLAIQYISVS